MAVRSRSAAEGPEVPAASDKQDSSKAVDFRSKAGKLKESDKPRPPPPPPTRAELRQQLLDDLAGIQEKREAKKDTIFWGRPAKTVDRWNLLSIFSLPMLFRRNYLLKKLGGSEALQAKLQQSDFAKDSLAKGIGNAQATQELTSTLTDSIHQLERDYVQAEQEFKALCRDWKKGPESDDKRVTEVREALKKLRGTIDAAKDRFAFRKEAVGRLAKTATFVKRAQANLSSVRELIQGYGLTPKQITTLPADHPQQIKYKQEKIASVLHAIASDHPELRENLRPLSRLMESIQVSLYQGKNDEAFKKLELAEKISAKMQEEGPEAIKIINLGELPKYQSAELDIHIANYVNYAGENDRNIMTQVSHEWEQLGEDLKALKKEIEKNRRKDPTGEKTGAATAVKLKKIENRLEALKAKNEGRMDDFIRRGQRPEGAGVDGASALGFLSIAIPLH